MNPSDLPGGPFDLVVDVGGNVGDFAAAAFDCWPDAMVVSVEPVPMLADLQRERIPEAAWQSGRWQVVEAAVTDADRLGGAVMNFCLNQHSASTLQQPGSVRRNLFGIADQWQTIQVRTILLDHLLPHAEGRERVLVKVDVEGHELWALRGGPLLLTLASTVVVEVQNAGDVFVGAGSPYEVNELLHSSGLRFAGLAGALLAPNELQGGERVLQFDGVWTRPPASK